MERIPITGYADRFSLAPGETIAFKVSSMSDQPYTARLVRVISGDPSPMGPGLIEEDIDASFAGTYSSRFQAINSGSCMRASPGNVLDDHESWTVAATIWPTTPHAGAQAVAGQLDRDGCRGLLLAVGPSGAEVHAGDGTKLACVATGLPLASRRWYRVWASFDAAQGEIRVGQAPVVPRVDIADAGEAGTRARACHAGRVPFLVAATGDQRTDWHFNGKIERPFVAAGALAAAEVEAIANGHAPAGIIAAWDFSRDISGPRVPDLGPHGFDGTLVNLPTRAMTGSAWDGSAHDWTRRPAHYAAVHFHDDDLHDCGWETDFTFTVPSDMRSGVYAARLRTADGADDMIPFFVTAPRGRPRNRICVLIPTYTYTVYANFARYNTDEAMRARIREWGASPWVPDDHPQFGHSTYNHHTDGSGIAYSSRLRPILSMRSGVIAYCDMPGSGCRHFPADSHLWYWLETKGYDFDVITDDELHDWGVDALSGYQVVMTCSHPEYHTPGSLDALQDYVDQGGRLLYLGGNGFYWKVAVSADWPGAVEIRRGEGGIRAWAADPGEYYNAFDGTYGGLWRRNGRPPQRLAGVGFSSQGDHEGSYYRRTPESRDPANAWIFEGIQGDLIGDFGLAGGGAAGFELDRADTALGTPLNAVVVARSEGHGDGFVLVPEEILTHHTTWPGEPERDLIRADIVWFETPGGGAVFSVGSITFCGSLPIDGCDNQVSTMLDNVIRRFSGNVQSPDGQATASA